MPEIVSDCPRCRTKHTTFMLIGANRIANKNGLECNEAFCQCRQCGLGTTFVVTVRNPNLGSQLSNQGGMTKIAGSLMPFISVDGFVSLKDMSAVSAPEHLPPGILNAFNEGATCLAVKCPNAAATMFRLCIDMATRGMLPAEPAAGQEDVGGLNRKVRRDLGLRLPWLFDTGMLPEGLRELSHCIKEDGNDGAHQGTLTAEDGEDLLDFATVLLDRLYSEPRRLELAKERRDKRRAPPA